MIGSTCSFRSWCLHSFRFSFCCYIFFSHTVTTSFHHTYSYIINFSKLRSANKASNRQSRKNQLGIQKKNQEKNLLFFSLLPPISVVVSINITKDIHCTSQNQTRSPFAYSESGNKSKGMRRFLCKVDAKKRRRKKKLFLKCTEMILLSTGWMKWIGIPITAIVVGAGPKQ